jgi:hypothetical protein
MAVEAAEAWQACGRIVSLSDCGPGDESEEQSSEAPTPAKDWAAMGLMSHNDEMSEDIAKHQLYELSSSSTMGSLSPDHANHRPSRSPTSSPQGSPLEIVAVVKVEDAEQEAMSPELGTGAGETVTSPELPRQGARLSAALGSCQCCALVLRRTVP